MSTGTIISFLVLCGFFALIERHKLNMKDQQMQLFVALVVIGIVIAMALL